MKILTGFLSFVNGKVKCWLPVSFSVYEIWMLGINTKNSYRQIKTSARILRVACFRTRVNKVGSFLQENNWNKHYIRVLTTIQSYNIIWRSEEYKLGPS